MPAYSAKTIDSLTQKIIALPRHAGRQLVAVAGAPASGKSTLAEELGQALAAAGRSVAVVPMDGFHLDNRILDDRGLRARKGAPETFDASGFVAMINRLKSDPEVIYPVFDRTRDIAIAGAARIDPDCDLAVIEGNYLLFDEAPWSKLAALWDLSIRVDVPEDILFDRLVQRWLDHDHTLEQARARADGNDLANARRIAASALPADILVDAAGNIL